MKEVAPPQQTTNAHRMRQFGALCYFWLVVGFVLGTAVLLWPVRWLTDSLHRANATQRAENLFVIALVLLYVAASFMVALWINRYVRGHSSARMRWSVVAVLTLVGLSTAWTWRQPGKLLSGLAGGGNLSALQTASGANFEFGAYPDSARLASLKARGVTVISLQDPSIPVEHEGVEEEQKMTKQLGITFVSAPMLPWFSENEESLAKIRQIATTGHGNYYVHCGLGRDRVNIVKRLIESAGGQTATGGSYKSAMGFEGRDADFDQGSLTSLGTGVWLVPTPLNEELYSCFIQGRPGNVVFLMDSTAPPQDSVLRENRRLLTKYAVPFTVVQVPSDSAGRMAATAAAARSVHAMTPPVTIVAYKTPWHNGRQKGDEAAVSFRDAFSPGSGWKITTGTVRQAGDPRAFSGGKEKSC